MYLRAHFLNIIASYSDGSARSALLSFPFKKVFTHTHTRTVLCSPLPFRPTIPFLATCTRIHSHCSFVEAMDLLLRNKRRNKQQGSTRRDEISCERVCEHARERDNRMADWALGDALFCFPLPHYSWQWCVCFFRSAANRTCSQSYVISSVFVWSLSLCCSPPFLLARQIVIICSPDFSAFFAFVHLVRFAQQEHIKWLTESGLESNFD